MLKIKNIKFIIFLFLGIFLFKWVYDFFGGIEPALQATLHTTRDERDIQIDSTNSSATGCEVETYDPGGSTPENNGFFITAHRQGSDFRQAPQTTAAVIKPSVALLKDVKDYNVHGGTSTTGFNTRTLNTYEGETWFVTKNSDTQFKLQTGTYKLSGRAPAYKGSHMFLALFAPLNNASFPCTT